jgi:hypothetical protein
MWSLHCQKRLAVFPSPDGMPLTKLSLAGNNFGDGKTANLFLLCKSDKKGTMHEHVLLSILLFYVGKIKPRTDKKEKKIFLI